MLSFLYRFLAGLQCADELTAEMIHTFEEARREALERGGWHYMRFAFRELTGQFLRILVAPGQLAPRSFWGALAGGAVLGLLAGVAVWLATPVSYTSSAVLMVRSAQIVPTNPELRPQGASLEERVDAITSNLLSRNVLTQIIRNFSLYGQEQTQFPLEDVIELMRENISIQPEDGLLLLSFTYQENRMIEELIGQFSAPANASPGAAISAQRVVTDLTSRVMDEDIRSRTSLSYQAQEFYQTQSEIAAQRWQELRAEFANLYPAAPQYAQVELDTELARARYIETQKRLHDIEELAQIEERQQGETLVVLDAASMPTRPDTSARQMVITGTGAGALAASGLWILLVAGSLLGRRARAASAGS